MKNSVLIFGGGFAGIATAVFLDSLGAKITLLERKPVLGGRAYAFKDRKTECWVDNGQHLLMGAYHETLRLIEHLGATRYLMPQEKLHVPLKGHDGLLRFFTLPHLPSPLNLLWGLLRFEGLSWGDRFRAFKIRGAVKKLARLRPSEATPTVDAWLESLGQSAKARENFWDILTLATLNDSPKIASAAALGSVITRGLMGSRADSRLLVPKGSLNDILATPAQQYLTLRGHEIRTATAVTKIHVLDHKVCGVETAEGERLKADYYVSALPFRALLKVLPQGFVDTLPYFEGMKNLKSAPIISINLWLDREVTDLPFVGLAGTKVHWFFNRNRILGKTDGPYHYVGVISGAYDLMEASRDLLVQTAVDELLEAFPVTGEVKVLHALVNREPEATYSPRPETEPFRPAQKSPFENFYVAGDWTRTGLPATIESAVLSAKLVVDELALGFKR